MSDFSIVTYTADGTPGVQYAVPFDFISRDHLLVLTSYDKSTGSYGQQLLPTADFLWVDDTTIEVVALAAGTAFSIVRQTPKDQPLVNWVAGGGALTAEELRLSSLQILFIVQENADRGLATAADADAALEAVSRVVAYDLVANVAAIPVNPEDNEYIEVLDTTGIQNFSPLVWLPPGFIGDLGLKARLRYIASGASWYWIDYAAVDPEARYIRKTAISTSTTSTSTTTVAASAAVKAAMDKGLEAEAMAVALLPTINQADETANEALQKANAAMPKAGGTFTGDVNIGTTDTTKKLTVWGNVGLTGSVNFLTASPASISADSAGNIRISADSSGTSAGSAINFDVDSVEALDINNAGYLRLNRAGFASGGICTQQSDSALNLGGGANPLNTGLNITLSGPDRVSATGYLMRWNTTIVYQYDKTNDAHIWHTGTGNERMRITSGGNVVVAGNLQAASINGGQPAEFRNVIINGDMRINQRGVTIAAAAVGQYGPDRWKKTGASTMTQIIEDGNFEPGAVYTLSGTGITTQQLTAPASGNWTLPNIPTTATKIQLELGTVATPFERRSIGAELVLCQRYYELSRYQIPTSGTVPMGTWSVDKRVTPTVAIKSYESGSDGSVSASGNKGFYAGTFTTVNNTRAIISGDAEL